MNCCAHFSLLQWHQEITRNMKRQADSDIEVMNVAVSSGEENVDIHVLMENSMATNGSVKRKRLECNLKMLSQSVENIAALFEEVEMKPAERRKLARSASESDFAQSQGNVIDDVIRSFEEYRKETGIADDFQNLSVEPDFYRLIDTRRNTVS